MLVNAITDLHIVPAKEVDIEASRAAECRAKRTERIVDVREAGGLATLEISRCVRMWHALNELTVSERDPDAMPPADPTDPAGVHGGPQWRRGVDRRPRPHPRHLTTRQAERGAGHSRGEAISAASRLNQLLEDLDRAFTTTPDTSERR